jgi:hypothetical protein
VHWRLLVVLVLGLSCTVGAQPRVTLDMPQLSAGTGAGVHNQDSPIQGFMMPLEPGVNQKHFLLSSVPLTCSFCIPGGPRSMAKVFTKTPVKYTQAPVVVEGRFAVLTDDPHGLHYRMTDAVSVK